MHWRRTSDVPLWQYRSSAPLRRPTRGRLSGKLLVTFTGDLSRLLSVIMTCIHAVSCQHLAVGEKLSAIAQRSKKMRISILCAV